VVIGAGVRAADDLDSEGIIIDEMVVDGWFEEM